jgi:uncharacterized DUF497 family protein
MFISEDINGFEWDDGNSKKNMLSHHVSIQETEQVFFNTPLMMSQDTAHSSENELRFAALGATDDGRLLAIFFTVRKKLIRIISARDMSKRERKIYYEKAQENT